MGAAWCWLTLVPRPLQTKAKRFNVKALIAAVGLHADKSQELRCESLDSCIGIADKSQAPQLGSLDRCRYPRGTNNVRQSEALIILELEM